MNRSNENRNKLPEDGKINYVKPEILDLGTVSALYGLVCSNNGGSADENCSGTGSTALQDCVGNGATAQFGRCNSSGGDAAYT